MRYFLLTAIYLAVAGIGYSDAAQPLVEESWSVCNIFARHLSAEKQIKKADFDLEFSNISQLKGTSVDPEIATRLFLDEELAGLLKVDERNWKYLSQGVDDIYKKRMKVQIFNVDVNNDGSLEKVIEFSNPYPYNAIFNYVIAQGDGYEWDPEFTSGGKPLDLLGELKVFEGSTYLFQVRPVVAKSDPVYKSRVNFRIYKPATNPMMDRGGVHVSGNGGVLCEFKITE